jgi:hypothetical protein
MLVYLKDWLDTKVRDNDHSNMYDISEYDTSILFLLSESLYFFSYIFF